MVEILHTTLKDSLGVTGPVIAAVRSYKELDIALLSNAKTIFLLAGEILGLQSIVKAAISSGKSVYLHVDLIKGISKDEAAMHYVSREIKPSGIISTHKSVILAAKKYKLSTVQRCFMIDSASLQTIYETSQSTKPDYIEVMPGTLFRQLNQLNEMTKTPIVAGGFIDEMSDVQLALSAGCVAISTSKRELWK